MNDVGAKHPWLHQVRLPRSDVWYLRARVPADVPNYPKREVKKSLGTSNYREACRLINAAAAEVEQEFAVYRLHGGPPPACQPPRISRIPRTVVNPGVTTIRYRGKGTPPSDLRSSEDLTEEDIRSFAAQHWRDWQGWIVAPFLSADPEWVYEHANLLESDSWELYGRPLNEVEVSFQPRTAAFLEKRGYYFDLSGSNALLLNDYLFRAGSEAYRRRIQRLRGISTAGNRDQLFDDIPISTQENPKILATNSNSVRSSNSAKERDILFDLEPWLDLLKSRGMKPRQMRQYESDLRKFAAGLKTISKMTREELQRFYEKELITDAPNTVIRKFSVIRNYWRYLQAHNVVSRDFSPFEGLMLPIKKAMNKRRTWTPIQVCSFWHLANSRMDVPLAQVIRIAAFTGSRIEAICDLSTDDVFTAADGRLSFHFDDKTDAGIRDVPVHSSLEPMISQMLASASSNKGYLIKADTANQDNDRSTGIGKRFSRLKMQQGHGVGFDFHSIRRTVVGMLFKINCPEAIAADIVGHEKPTMTYGLYNEACDISVKRQWLEHALSYPDTKFMEGQH